MSRDRTIFIGSGGGGAATSLALTGTTVTTYPTMTGSGTASGTITPTFPGEKFVMPSSAATLSLGSAMSDGQDYILEITGDTVASRVLTLPSGTFYDVNAQATATTVTIAQNAKETLRIRRTSSGNYLLFGAPPSTAPTGTGAQVLANSPTLITPTIGAATATSINGSTIPVSNGDGVMMTGQAAFDAFRKLPFFATDLLASQTSGGSFDPFIGAAIVSGTPSAGNAEVDHPGVARLNSSSSANSGYRIYHSDTTLLLGGGEMFECVFNIATLTDTTIRVGFHDCNSSSDATDGCYLEIPSTGVAVFKTANNATRTTSLTVHTLSISTWYRVLIYLDATAANATCTIYNMAGAIQGNSRTNSANIPTGAGRFTGCGIIATDLNTDTVASAIVDVDYLAYGQTILRSLVR